MTTWKENQINSKAENLKCLLEKGNEIEVITEIKSLCHDERKNVLTKVFEKAKPDEEKGWMRFNTNNVVYSYTLLMLACSLKHKRACDIIIENLDRKDLIKKDFTGKTALHYACCSGLKSVVRKLEKKLSPEDFVTRDGDREFSLSNACHFCHEDIALRILNIIPENFWDSDKYSCDEAISYAIQGGLFKVLEKMLKKCKKCSGPEEGKRLSLEYIENYPWENEHIFYGLVEKETPFTFWEFDCNKTHCLMVALIDECEVEKFKYCLNLTIKDTSFDFSIKNELVKNTVKHAVEKNPEFFYIMAKALVKEFESSISLSE